MRKFKSAREMMQAIDKGEIPVQHVGPKNVLILKQEIFSLKNSYNPDTMTEDEMNMFNAKLALHTAELRLLTTTSEKEALESIIDSMLNP